METTAVLTVDAVEGRGADSRPACFHCGTACVAGRHSNGGREFCCAGCQTVFELLSEAGLDRYYELGDGVRERVDAGSGEGKYGFLDNPEVRSRFVDFEDPTTTRVTFHLPAIHCLACVWLLENLFRLKPGIGKSIVHFPRKQVVISFDPREVRLSEVAALLDSVGYPPELRLADLDRPPANPVMRRLWLQVGVAGFAFGNTMLFSIAIYLGLDAFSGPSLMRLFGYLSLLLSLPVVLISARDYWVASWRALRVRQIPIEVPIAAGIVAIWGQSAWEVLAGRGEGYFDSLAGLLFFLNIGRIFQQKTFDRLAFDRDYRSFFPLSVLRCGPASEEERIALAQVVVGDRLLVRNGELVPADARLISGNGTMDYSFVTGEAEPVPCAAGAILHAGGRQIGGSIVIETLKPVNQGYLTDLWNQDAFRKDRDDSFGTLTNRYSRRFTWIIMGVASASALFWAPMDVARGLKAFVSVLIVACPCALALAAPFALGSAQRILARRRIFLRNPEVIESLARIDTVVFDKTGTLTSATGGAVVWQGEPLGPVEKAALRSLSLQSTHPLARRVGEFLGGTGLVGDMEVTGYREVPACGMEGELGGVQWRVGSAAWLRETGVEVPEGVSEGSRVVVAVDGRHRGVFQVGGRIRAEADALLRKLGRHYELALLSGDNEREKERFTALFGGGARLHFNQSPLRKLVFIRDLQGHGRRVLMAGDGLNDAGALRQADVGVAVVEDTAAFSPASDVILQADEVPRMGAVLDFAKRVVRVVRISFLVSTAYNVVGLGIAASGRLSPVVCAVLMPLSSVTVVLVACGLAEWAGRRAGVGGVRTGSSRTVEHVATEGQHT